MNSDDPRINFAMEAIRRAKSHVITATEAPDPVWQRRHLARAAVTLRAAADKLDDEGRLSPDWNI